MMPTKTFPYPVPVVRGILLDVTGRLLLLRRKNSTYGNGEWSLPGGKIDYLTSPEQSIVREVLEETGLILKAPRFLFYQDSPPIIPDAMHCLNLYFEGRVEGAVQLNEENEEFAWVDPGELGAYRLAFGGGEAVARWLKAGTQTQ